MSTTYPIDQAKLAGLVLDRGEHESPEEGMGLLEAVSYVCGFAHTSYPRCVSPVLTAMGCGLNDALPDDLRQRLIPLIPLLPGTRDDGHDETRSYMAVDWLVRVHLPAFLDLVPACQGAAAKVRELGRIVDAASVDRAGPAVRQARATAAAAWAATGDAVWPPGKAGEWATTWAAAGDSVWVAAPGAAWHAARNACRDAARVAPWDSVQSVVAPLRLSSIDLFRAMASVGTTP